MKLAIPSIGDAFRLTEDWTFPCFFESRNLNFIRYKRPGVIKDDARAWDLDTNQSVPLTIPKESILTVQRIYIRSGKKEWDSLSFSVREPSLPVEPEPATTGRGRKKSAVPKKTAKITGKFWAKLRDVNEIECEPLEA